MLELLLDRWVLLDDEADMVVVAIAWSARVLRRDHGTDEDMDAGRYENSCRTSEARKIRSG